MGSFRPLNLPSEWSLLERLGLRIDGEYIFDDALSWIIADAVETLDLIEYAFTPSFLDLGRRRRIGRHWLSKRSIKHLKCYGKFLIDAEAMSLQ